MSERSIMAQEVRRPDRFVVAAQGAFARLAQNTRLLFWGVAILVLVSASALFMVHQKDEQSAAGREALFLAEKTYERELEMIASAEQKTSGGKQEKAPAPLDLKDPKNSNQATNPKKDERSELMELMGQIEHRKLNVEQNFSGTVAEYKKVAERYKGTRVGFDAETALGTLYFDHQEYEKAVPWFQAAADRASSPFEQAMALYSLGFAQESAGNCPEALKSYEKSIARSETGLKGDTLLAMARCHEATKNPVLARSIYDRILTELPNTPFAKSAEAYRSALD